MKKQLSIFIIILSVILCSTFAFASEPSGFDGGTGTESDPYLISDKIQLDNVRNDLDAHYKLTDNICFAASDFAEGGTFENNSMEWLPIGDIDNPFTGTFDGNGYQISGLKININASADTYAGLFGVIETGNVTNLAIRDSQITVTGAADLPEWISIYAGSVAGLVKEGRISCCSSNAYINVSSVCSLNIAGGIAGGIDGNSEVSKCFNAGNINAYSTENTSVAGGIIGDAKYGSISDCYNSGPIIASAKDASYAVCGGIAGELTSVQDKVSSVRYCYNVGEISVITSFDSTEVIGKAGTGGIVGTDLYSTVSDCYSLTDCIGYSAGTKTYENVAKLSQEQMSEKANFTAFDFENTWEISEETVGYKYPTLKYILHDVIQVKSIAVTKEPKTDYLEKEELDLTGGEITVTYSDDSTEVISLTADAVSTIGFDSTSAGEKEMYISYMGITTTLAFTVDHNYEEIIVGPTCTENGYTSMVCAICEDSYIVEGSEVIASGHEEEIIPGKEATCTEKGLTDGSYCTLCGETINEQEETDMIDHVTTIEHTENGYVKSCENCDYSAQLSEAEIAELIDSKLGEIESIGLTIEDEEIIAELYKEYGFLSAEHKATVSNSAFLELAKKKFDLYHNGDINFDGIIRVTDLSILLYNYDNLVNLSADLNKDGTVNNDDLSIFLHNYSMRIEL